MPPISPLKSVNPFSCLGRQRGFIPKSTQQSGMEVRATKSNTTFPDKPEVVIRRNAPTSESKHGYLGACAGDKNALPQKHCDGQNKYLVRIDALRRLRFKTVFL